MVNECDVALRFELVERGGHGNPCALSTSDGLAGAEQVQHGVIGEEATAVGEPVQDG